MLPTVVDSTLKFQMRGSCEQDGASHAICPTAQARKRGRSRWKVFLRRHLAFESLVRVLNPGRMELSLNNWSRLRTTSSFGAGDSAVLCFVSIVPSLKYAQPPFVMNLSGCNTDNPCKCACQRTLIPKPPVCLRLKHTPRSTSFLPSAVVQLNFAVLD